VPDVVVLELEVIKELLGKLPGGANVSSDTVEPDMEEVEWCAAEEEEIGMVAMGSLNGLRGEPGLPGDAG
jgi:hypothetical protein